MNKIRHMTREEILKGLECCSEFLCGECPYKIYQHVDYKLRCNYRLISDLNTMFNKKGKWIKRTWIIFDSEKVGHNCSECNTTWDAPTKYCPNCGIAMEID